MTISWNKSLALARRQTGIGVIQEVVDWFSYTKDSYDANELKAHARKLIAKTLKDEYGDLEHWSGEWFYVPLPFLKYVNRGFPFIEFRVDLYIIASVCASFDYGYYTAEQHAEFTKPLKRELEKLRIPILFLYALAKGDLGRMSQCKVVERDNLYVTLDIPDFGEVRLRDSLIPCWRNFFRAKAVGEALCEAGLLPKDAASLIDACLEKPAEVLQLRSGAYEDLVTGLRNLGWNKTQAEERANYVMEKHPDVSLEEKIKYALSD